MRDPVAQFVPVQRRLTEHDPLSGLLAPHRQRGVRNPAGRPAGRIRGEGLEEVDARGFGARAGDAGAPLERGVTWPWIGHWGNRPQEWLLADGCRPREVDPASGDAEKFTGWPYRAPFAEA